MLLDGKSIDRRWADAVYRNERMADRDKALLSNNKAITAYELLTGERIAKMTDAQLLALDESGQLRKYLNMLDTPANIKDVVNDALIEYESRLDTAMKQMTVNRFACPKSKDGE